MRQRPERADDVLGFFNRQLVPIYLEVHLADKVARRIWTAFVFSVNNRWMVMTAGHCITEVEQEREAGARVLNCKLLDGLNSQAAHADPIPFEYDDFRPRIPWRQYLESMLKIAEGLRDHVRALLKANETSWERG